MTTPAAPAPKLAYSVAEFLVAFGVSRTKFYSEIKSGRIRVAKLGSRTLVPAAAAQAWLDSLVAETAEGRGR